MEPSKIGNLISNKQCNNRCLLCARSDADLEEMDIERIEDKLRSMKADGFNKIILTGGEPTLRKDLFDIISLSKKIGFLRLDIQTNGRRFSDIEFAKKIVCGNESFIDIFLSIPGHTNNIHESITNTIGSFDETSKGIDNLISLGASVTTNTVINKLNFHFLKDIALFLKEKGVRIIQFSFIHPKGSALNNQDLLIPDIHEVIPFVHEALALNSGGTRILIEAIPFCLLGDDHVFATENLVPKSYGMAAYAKIKGSECQRCFHDPVCPGIWENYYSSKGFEFKRQSSRRNVA